VVPSSGPRPPTNPKDVAIYPKEPKKYEKLGVVEVPVGGDVRWDEKGESTAGFEKLKAGAAARGANGILLTSPTADSKQFVVAGYKGTFYQVPDGEPAGGDGGGDLRDRAVITSQVLALVALADVEAVLAHLFVERSAVDIELGGGGLAVVVVAL
jgi:hypothetical protein